MRHLQAIGALPRWNPMLAAPVPGALIPSQKAQGEKGSSGACGRRNTSFGMVGFGEKQDSWESCVQRGPKLLVRRMTCEVHDGAAGRRRGKSNTEHLMTFPA